MTYLSFVVVGRNDGYGGDFLGRLRTFVDSLEALVEQHRLNAQIVLVEWNPPDDRDRFADAIEWSKADHLSTKIIEVPAEVHRSLKNADEMPLFEYIGKNVGIRRADGDFVVATNPDIVFNDALIDRFAERDLSSDAFYRINRFDVEGKIPLSANIDDRLQFCVENAFRVSTFVGKQPISILDCFKRAATYAPRHPQKFAFERRDWSSRCVVQLIKRLGTDIPSNSEIRNPTELDHIHGSASGDFLLMAADRWHEMGGYPELNTSLRIDYYGCVMAAAMGLKQIVLRDPYRIYHQEHDRSERMDRPTTGYESFQANSVEMLRSGKIVSAVRNDESWGLRDESLPELLIQE
jgi:hypothetical protein